MDTEFLHQPRRDFGYHLGAKERQQVNPQYPLYYVDVFGMALTSGYDLILLHEQICGLLECLADLQRPRTALAHEFKIPILSKVFGMGKAFFLRGDTPVFTGQVG
jgi:hypothetical protein